ncbi:MAG: hypothetical protein AAF989_03280 [Planctomycetota bacterium]
MSESSTWHLRGRELDLTGLSEPQLRHKLLEIAPEDLAGLRVRHGNGQWHAANDVMELFRELARHGCYIRVGRSVEGPFTRARAMEILKEKIMAARKHGAEERVRIRMGRKAQWITPRQFAAHCRDQQPNVGGISPPPVAPAEVTDAVFRSTPIIDSHVDAIFGDGTPQPPPAPLNRSSTQDPAETRASSPHRAPQPKGEAKPQSSSTRLEIPPPPVVKSDTDRINETGSSSNTIEEPWIVESVPHTETPVSRSVDTSQPSLASAGEMAPDTNPDAAKREATTPMQPLEPNSPGADREQVATGERASGDPPTSDQEPESNHSATPETKSRPRVAPARIPAPEPGRTTWRPEHVDWSEPSSHPPSRTRGMLAASLVVFVLVGVVTYSLITFDVDEGAASTLAVSWNSTPSPLSDPVPTVVEDPAIVQSGIPANFLFRPTFHTSKGTATGGVIFAARRSESAPTVLISAMHLLGPRGGLETSIDALDVFTHWKSVDLLDCQNGDHREDVAGNALIIPGAKPFPEDSLHGDVIGFRTAPAFPLSPLDFSTSKPWVGEKVWLLASIAGNAIEPHTAKVSAYERGRLIVTLDDNVTVPTDLQKVAGSPIVNSANEVIGVISNLESRGGQSVAVATPASRFIDYL